MDELTRTFYILAAGTVLAMAFRGWRMGIVRQLVSLAAIVAAYVGGWLFGGYLIPILRPLGLPDRILTIIGSAILGIGIYFAIGAFSSIVFKKTSDQTITPVRWGFGLAGAGVGAIFGLVIVLAASVGVRLIGTLGESTAAEGNVTPTAGGFAALKHSLESGATGFFLEHLDPLPDKVYDTVGLIGRLSSNPAGIARFSELPQVKAIGLHPKIAALQDDPEVERAIREQDFMSLMRHPLVIEAANDPEVAELVGSFDVLKELDAALQHTTSNPPPRQR